MTIIIPVIDAILGKDIITGETLNDFERGMKAAGAAIDLFTLGQAMVLAGGVEAGVGIIVKTLAVEMVSNAAGYSAGYAANEMGMPLPVTWILSVATGCTVSATVGGYLFTSADGTITKCTPEEAGDLIKRLDKTDSPASFADMMSPEDAARYLRFLENGSTEGLTSAELEGIKKVDELLALKKISYQDVLDIRNSGKALESGSNSYSGEEWCRYFRETYGNNNVTWENATPSQLARSWQGSGKYIGIDEYTDVTVNKGTILYRGEPNGTEYFTTLDAIEQSGRNATTIFEGLQVEKNPIHGYRGEMQGYLFNEDVASAYGITNANPQFGNGGLPQYYVPDVQDLISKGILTPVDNIKLYK